MSNRKPHNHHAGYIFERKHPRGHLVCLIASEAQIDISTEKYIVVLECTGGKGIIGPPFTSIPKAREFIKSELRGTSVYEWTESQ